MVPIFQNFEEWNEAMRSALPERRETDTGHFHLTPHGWVRQDLVPFPHDRRETWLYEMARPTPETREIVTLTKVWRAPGFDQTASDDLHALFGEAVKASPTRDVRLKTRVG